MKKLLLVFALLLALCGVMAGCDDGGNTPPADDTQQHTHTFGEWVEIKAATCKEEGLQFKSCTDCGHTVSEVIAKEHTYGEWTVTVSATCMTEGSRYRTCSVCSCKDVEALEIVADAHSPVWTSDGTYHWRECSNSGCNVKFDKAEHIPSSEWKNDATSHWRACTVDGCTARFEESAHSYNDENTCPTCLRYKDDGLKFTLIGNVYTVSDYTGTEKTVIIPSTYNGKPVTSIRECAFSGCSGLMSISIPASVTSIGYEAFYYCSGLRVVHITDVAAWCNISFGDFCANPLCLAKNLYLNGNLVTALEIPSGVTTISDYAFDNCSSLTSISIPSSVTSIGSSAFRDCSGLTAVYITDIAAWCNISFNGFFANPLYYAENLYLNGNLVTALEIPSGVTSIGKYAFYKCSGLTSITIPASVTSIGSSAFDGCSNLSYNTYDNAYYLGNDSNPYLVLVRATSSSITSCNINSSTKVIYDNAFRGCSSLTSISIPASVTSIGSSAFYGCSWLKTVTFGEGSKLETIGYEAFYGCSRLTSISIPASVTSIGKDAFDGCRGLTAVHITDVAAWCNISFDNYSANPLYYAKKLYLNGNLVTELVIPSGVTSIGSYAFRNCSGLTSITVAEGNTVYHSSGNCLIEMASKTMVLGCKNSVIPTDGSVTSIGEWAFSGCSGLTSISIPASVASIGYAAFSGCSGLTSISIPASFTSIGDWAFENCSGLTSISIPASVTSIGYHAFSGCSGLTSVVFETTTGWWCSYYYDDTGRTSISATDLANASIAATYLTSTDYYRYYCWKRS